MKRALPIALVLSALACAPTLESPYGEAGADARETLDASRRPPRALDAAIETLFGECALDTDCPSGARCNRAFARGVCQVPCDPDCPVGSTCVGSLCFEDCTPGANECRDDALCIDAPGGLEVCYPSCSDVVPDRHCGFGSCIGGVCRTGIRGSLPVGSPCTVATRAECESTTCQPVEGYWPGGMCTVAIRMPAHEDYLVPGPMPAGGCDDGLVALGTGYQLEGDAGYCVPRCVADTDCRDGYRCERRGVFDAPLHDDGGCVPWTCGYIERDTPCSPDRECRPLSGVMRSACFLLR
jgi:hypothetical protein